MKLPRPRTALEALERLKAGNGRFVRDEGQFQSAHRDSIAELAYAQDPFATILGCSDSRVPPELVFDAGFGDLFIIRVAGNVVSPGVIGSLEYAAIHLRTPLFVVLGHERCGAVKAALEAKHGLADHPPRLMRLLNQIVPALSGLPEGLSPVDELDAAVEANVRSSIRQILEIPGARERRDEGAIMLVGARYDLDTGCVTYYE